MGFEGKERVWMEWLGLYRYSLEARLCSRVQIRGRSEREISGMGLKR